jgi:hypothetical protein
MTENPLSCRVAPLAECNHATASDEMATNDETVMQPMDLIALSLRVVERNQCNQLRNMSATGGLPSGGTYATRESSTNTAMKSKSCMVAFSKGGNYATYELRQLMGHLSQAYGGDEAGFLAEYMDSVIHEWSHDLKIASRCFSDLVALASVKNR